MRSLRLGPLLWGLVLTPTAFLLGYIGFLMVPNQQISRLNALYGAIQLFA